MERTEKKPPIIVHKAGHEGIIELDAMTGAIQTRPEDRPAWAEGLAVALLPERHKFYATRLGEKSEQFKHLIEAPNGIDVQDLGGELADEMHVVADENERALVALEGEDERLDGVDVEVRRRFVHEQQVRRVNEELDKVEARLFTTAENASLFVDLVLAGKEGAEDGTRFIFAQRAVGIHHLLEHALVGIEGRGAMALASATRCCWPPDSSNGKRLP